MAFDRLRPQPPRTPENTRVPEAARAYATTALARSNAAARDLSPAMDIAFGDDPDQALDIYRTAVVERAPVLVFFHGGAWAHGYKEWNGFMAPALVDAPAVFVSVGYRLVPEHKWSAPLDDAFAALRWVYEHIDAYGGDPTQIHVAGWSAGGTLAALLALRRDLYPRFGLPAGVVKSCMVTSTSFEFRATDMAPGNRGITYRDFLYTADGDALEASPIHHVDGNTVPFFIAHGEQDFPNVLSTGPRMVSALEAAGSPVVHRVYPGLDHYAMNLAQGDRDHDWVTTARALLRPA
ncbi:MAG: alpha/beta hydrolase [Alphaproteobacteria bacterium]|nr:alpha/beta hydrolase [Alphaproteobacteria bacterium]